MLCKQSLLLLKNVSRFKPVTHQQVLPVNHNYQTQNTHRQCFTTPWYFPPTTAHMLAVTCRYVTLIRGRPVPLPTRILAGTCACGSALSAFFRCVCFVFTYFPALFFIRCFDGVRGHLWGSGIAGYLSQGGFQQKEKYCIKILIVMADSVLTVDEAFIIIIFF